MPQPSAMRVALALLGAARDEPLTTPMLIGAADVLGLSSNSMRIALSRLTSSADVITRERGVYALSKSRKESFAHVRRYRTAFAQRTTWRGDFLGVLTADLPRRNATLVRRRSHALELVGFRPFTHELFVRPDNLAGGRDSVTAQLQRLGLDPEAEIIGVTLDERQREKVQRAWPVKADQQRAVTLARKVRALLPLMNRRPPREVAAQSFWLGDEVLRFLARDPLLPEQWADPKPRHELAELMSELDERGQHVWRSLMENLEKAA
jgi:phenylacetic acid degradation operon negative regulatory protein